MWNALIFRSPGLVGSSRRMHAAPDYEQLPVSMDDFPCYPPSLI